MSQRKNQPAAGEVSAMLADRIGALCADLLPNGRRIGQEWRCGSVYGEVGRSMGVRLTGSKRGRWADFSGDDRGDALGLVQAVKGCSTVEALRWASGWLGLAPGTPVPDRVQARARARADEIDKDLEARVRRALQWWGEAQPIEGTVAERYFHECRAIEADLGEDVRFHGRLPYTHDDDSKTFHPAAVSLVRTAAGTPRGIWRIYLRDDGSDKANLSPCRMGLGDIAGGAVQLTVSDRELWLAEGVETAASLLDVQPDIAVWAGLSASLLRKIVVPDCVESVVLAQENDKADARGRRASPDAMAALATRLRQEGRRVRIIRPPAHHKDFNDVLRAMRRQGEGWAA